MKPVSASEFDQPILTAGTAAKRTQQQIRKETHLQRSVTAVMPLSCCSVACPQGYIYFPAVPDLRLPWELITGFGIRLFWMHFGARHFRIHTLGVLSRTRISQVQSLGSLILPNLFLSPSRKSVFPSQSPQKVFLTSGVL